MILRNMWLVLVATMIMLAGPDAVFAAGPVETSVFAVQGVAADVTDKDVATAKEKALFDVQMKAIVMLAQRLGNETFAAEIAKLESKDVLPLLKSLSIEEEATGPGHYIGKFTVRFLPARVEKLFASYGVNVVSEQATPMLVLPIWKTAEGAQLWEDNLWRAAWLGLHAEQSLVPLIIPIGDIEDTAALTAQDVLNLDPIKLETLRRRYGTRTILVAIAEPAAGDGVHAMMNGESELGKVTFDKIYPADPATLDASAALAAQRFHAVMIDKYKSDKAKASAGQTGESAEASHSIPVSVSFASPSEWNAIRSRILSSPGIIGVDVSALAGDGAVIRLMYVGDLQVVQTSMPATGLQMSQVGGNWVIQSLL
ncbi:MAG: DUF2066 domain-containing protein [Aestuariivirga sp.]